MSDANKTSDVKAENEKKNESPFANGPTPQDLPTREQRDELEGAVKKLLNPTGQNTQMEGYVTSTFDYIQNMMEKIANSEDKDAAANEIAEDLKGKFEGWAKKKEKELKEEEPEKKE